MHNHNSPEIKLIPTVKPFCRDHFPDCLIVFHPSVYFRDDTFKDDTWAESDARIQLGTDPKTNHVCEITPDYGIFRKHDVIGIRLVVGNQIRRELPLIPPESPHFAFLTEFPDPIPYVAWERCVQTVPAGKVMVVVLKDDTYPVAVIDHKGGRTYNIQGQRRKALAQARRFGASEAYMLTEVPISEPVKCEEPISASLVATYADCEIWRLNEPTSIEQPAAGN